MFVYLLIHNTNTAPRKNEWHVEDMIHDGVLIQESAALAAPGNIVVSSAKGPMQPGLINGSANVASGTNVMPSAKVPLLPFLHHSQGINVSSDEGTFNAKRNILAVENLLAVLWSKCHDILRQIDLLQHPPKEKRLTFSPKITSTMIGYGSESGDSKEKANKK